jgi:glycerol uptake facilitator-like aquaporin
VRVESYDEDVDETREESLLPNSCSQKFKDISFYKAMSAEFLGTYLLLFFVFGFGLELDKSAVPTLIDGVFGCGFAVIKKKK